MDLGLRDATAVVTGGSSGMGRAAAECLADDGARVAVFARRQAELDETVAALRQRGSPDPVGLSVDVTDGAAIEAAFAELGARWGALNILVNTIGPGDMGTIDTLGDEGWSAQPRARPDERGALHARGAAVAAQGRVGAHRERLGALDEAPDADADRLHRREGGAHQHEQEPREDARQGEDPGEHGLAGDVPVRRREDAGSRAWRSSAASTRTASRI